MNEFRPKLSITKPSDVGEIVPNTQPTTAEALVSEVRELVSLPDVAIQINARVEDPHSTAGDIAAIIATDPGLTARLLRIANSPFFGLTARVATVDRAVTVVGAKSIRDLVIATAAIRSFKGIPNTLVSMDDFWYHSLYCALIARLLGRNRKLPQADSLFVAGLLHDVGQLVIFNRAPEAAQEIMRLSMEDPHTMDTHQAEMEVLGFDHARVGGLLLHNWHLPPLLEECVALHHRPAEAKQFPAEVAMVHLANVIATMAEINSTHLDDVPAIAPGAWKQAGLREELLEPVMREAQRQFRDARQVFLADAA